MAWFNVNSARLFSVCEWVWLKLGFLRRLFVTGLRLLVRVSRLAIGLRPNRGGRDDDRERSDENKLPEGSAQVDVGGERAAGSGREPACERPGCQEEGEESDSEAACRVETTDELFCGYDSTWETEGHQKSTVKRSGRAASKYYKFSRFESAAKDMQNYRHDYPTRQQRWIGPGNEDMPNLKFYLGKTPSKPNGIKINVFHNEWHGDYEKLEYVHTYIQWLFPLQEPGMNNEASTLTKEEIKEFLENDTAKKNLLKSYKLMLDFYGIELCDEETGKVKRASNWRDRFYNLNSHTHNSLRITRILKCQGTLGYPHYQAPLVQFFLEETLVHGNLPNLKDSVLNYFVFAVLDKRQRRSLIKFAYLNYDRKDEFVWCPTKIQKMWSRRAEQ